MKNSVQLLAFKAGKPEILDALGQPINPLNLIELAGRTCYKSHDKITADSAKRFVGALIKSGHEAMIEFSWLTFKFPKDKFRHIYKWLIEMLENEIFIKVTEDDGDFLVSGNFRHFRDMFRRLENSDDQQLAIFFFLLKNYPEIIEECMDEWTAAKFKRTDHGPDYWYDKFQADGVYGLPEQLTNYEKLKHYWVAAKFIGSRAFTHQLIRHRLSSFAQESQRYCDERGFFDNEYFIVPPSMEEAEIDKLFVAQLGEVDSMYQKLLKLLGDFGLRGKKLKEDARFILPNAVASEICMASNLEQWFRVFNLRLDSHAQWEIRGVIEELQRQIYTAIPEAENLYEQYLSQKGI